MCDIDQLNFLTSLCLSLSVFVTDNNVFFSNNSIYNLHKIKHLEQYSTIKYAIYLIIIIIIFSILIIIIISILSDLAKTHEKQS